MHFTGLVAVHARHVFVRIVNVRLIVLFDPWVFTVNAPSVATGTRSFHGRCFDKPVCGEQTAIGIIRSADITLSATGMAGKAVSVHGRIDGSLSCGIFVPGSLLDSLFYRSQGKMQAGYSRCHNVFMAFTAGRRGVRVGGVSDHALVRRPPVIVFRGAAVTVFAGDPTVVGFQKGGFHIDFFLQLQRSQWTASPLAGGFLRFQGFRFERFDLPAQSDKFFQIGVTVDAPAATTFPGFREALVDPRYHAD